MNENSLELFSLLSDTHKFQKKKCKMPINILRNR